MKHVENIMTKSRTIFAVGTIAGVLMWSPCIVAQVNPDGYGAQVVKGGLGEQPAVYALISDEIGVLRRPSNLNGQTIDVHAVDDEPDDISSNFYHREYKDSEQRLVDFKPMNEDLRCLAASPSAMETYCNNSD